MKLIFLTVSFFVLFVSAEGRGRGIFRRKHKTPTNIQSETAMNWKPAMEKTVEFAKKYLKKPAAGIGAGVVFAGSAVGIDAIIDAAQKTTTAVPKIQTTGSTTLSTTTLSEEVQTYTPATTASSSASTRSSFPGTSPETIKKEQTITIEMTVVYGLSGGSIALIIGAFIAWKLRKVCRRPGERSA